MALASGPMCLPLLPAEGPLHRIRIVRVVLGQIVKPAAGHQPSDPSDA
jgi:hypothetical protein